MTIAEMSDGRQVDIAGDIKIWPNKLGDNVILVSDDGYELLFPYNLAYEVLRIISFTAGGEPGRILLDSDEVNHVLMPQDAGQLVICPSILDDD